MAECPENVMQPQRHLQVLFFKRRHTINQFRRVVFRGTTTHFTISTSTHRIVQLVKIIAKPSKAPLSITLFPSSIPSPHMYNVSFTPPCWSFTPGPRIMIPYLPAKQSQVTAQKPPSPSRTPPLLRQGLGDDDKRGSAKPSSACLVIL